MGGDIKERVVLYRCNHAIHVQLIRSKEPVLVLYCIPPSWRMQYNTTRSDLQHDIRNILNTTVCPGRYSPGFFLARKGEGGADTRSRCPAQERRIPVAWKANDFHLTLTHVCAIIKLEEWKNTLETRRRKKSLEETEEKWH